MKNIFPQSRDLKEIVEFYKWALYDVHNSPKGRAFSWEELNQMTPANHYEIGHNYLFIPIPNTEQTLKQAYTLTKGLGPSLFIDNPNDDRWFSLDVSKKSNGYVALFTRLFFEENFVVASSIPTEYLLNPDCVLMGYEKLIDTFRKYFRVISPEIYGCRTPIPIPIIPQMN